MKKKYLIIVSFVVVLLGLIISYFIVSNRSGEEKNTKLENKANFSDVELSTSTFTVGDNNTDLEVLINNSRDEKVTIHEVEITFYDDKKKIIASKNEKIDTTISANESNRVHIVFDERFVDVADISFKILNQNNFIPNSW